MKNIILSLAVAAIVSIAVTSHAACPVCIGTNCPNTPASVFQANTIQLFASHGWTAPEYSTKRVSPDGTKVGIVGRKSTVIYRISDHTGQRFLTSCRDDIETFLSNPPF